MVGRAAARCSYKALMLQSYCSVDPFSLPSIRVIYAYCAIHRAFMFGWRSWRGTKASPASAEALNSNYQKRFGEVFLDSLAC